MTLQKKQKTDVVVVGAGPAGSSAARISAKAGLDVVVLEKQSEVGTHVQCGEGVTRFINKIDREIRLKKEHISTRISDMKVILPIGMALVMQRRRPNADGYIINRDIYDRYLAEKAEKYGAEIRRSSPVLSPIIKKKQVRGVVVHDKNKGEKYELYGKIVVAADGVSSMIGKKAGLPVKIKESDKSICAESRFTGIEVDDNTIEVWFLPECEMTGYAWVFPKSNNVANIGVGIMSHTLRQKQLRVQDVLDDFVKKRFSKYKPKPILNMNGVVPLGVCSKLVAPGIALTGDSGRMVVPVSGAGTENAIKSGMMLGKTISNGDFSLKNLKRYEKEYMSKIGDKMQVLLYGRRALELIYDISPNMVWFGSDVVNAILDLQHVFMDLTGAREEKPTISTGVGRLIADAVKFLT